MPKTNHGIAPGLLDLHAAVLLFGTAGLFGKWLALPSWGIVFGRSGFAAIALLIVLVVLRERVVFDPRTTGVFAALGVLLAFHWIAFFKAIQVSTVAVGLLAFSTFPVFITLIEPFWFKEKRRKIDGVTAGLVVGGLYIMTSSSPLDGRIFSGALWGTFSGFSFAVLSLLNRQWVKHCAPVTIAFYQNLFAALFLLPVFFLTPLPMDGRTAGMLLLLGVVCTALSHSLFIRGLASVRAQPASIIAGLEPVYGIVFAVLFLREVPSLSTMLGGVLILSAALMATALRERC